MKRLFSPAVLGHISACIVCGWLIHMYLADWLAPILGESRDATYRWGMILLALWGIGRGLAVYAGVDPAAKWVETKFRDGDNHADTSPGE